MSSEKIDLDQVRSHLAEMNSFLRALSKCQVPGNSVSDIHNLKVHLEGVVSQLNDMLLAETQKESNK